MSRIDEALRKAMEGDRPSDVRTVAEELDALANEAIPEEMPEPIHARPAQVHHFAYAVPVAGPGPLSLKPAALPAAADEPAPLRLIERMDARLAQKLVIDDKTMPLSREQYRRLAASLHHTQGVTGLKVVMIGSAAPGEGKTLTAANLALTFSESYNRSVLLIDGDLRRPSLHQLFHVENASGLSDGLSAGADKPLMVRQLSEHLALLPAGVPSADPMAGLTSPRMARLIAEAREMFDWVIIDTPPLGLLPDANLLGSLADGAIIIVAAGSTSCYMVKRAIEAIGRAKLLGIVLNRAERNTALSQYDYYDHREAPRQKGRKPL